MRASLALVLFLGGSLAAAQTVPATNPAGLVQTRIQGIDIPAISGAPFSAKIVVTWVQPLVGGGTRSRMYYTQVARDAQGRVRQEIRNFISASSAATPPLESFTISDPVAATRTTCVQSTMTCTTAAFHPKIPLTDEAGTDVAGAQLAAKGSNVSRVSLGEQTIDQLPVTGIRETSTSVTGDNGTARMVVSHRDLWYSPDLQMDLAVVRSTPQLGQLTISVTELVLGDPNMTWFAVPSTFQTAGASNP